MKRKKYFKRFLNGRNEIAFETKELFLRNPSTMKLQLAKSFHQEFPCSSIAYHFTLLGNPNLFIIDLDELNEEHVKTIVEWSVQTGWDVPIVKLSGRKGYHLNWKTESKVGLKDMENTAKQIEEETKITLDLKIYRKNHLIRGFYSIHLASGKYSEVVDVNNGFLPVVFQDSMFDIKSFPIARIKHVPIKEHDMESGDTLKRDKKLKSPTHDVKPDTCIRILEKKGTIEGMRHDGIFLLGTYLKALNYTYENAETRLLAFNERCDPPDEEDTVRAQLKQVYTRSYEIPSCKWLKSRDFCVGICSEGGDE